VTDFTWTLNGIGRHKAEVCAKWVYYVRSEAGAARPTLRKFTSTHAGVTAQPLLNRRMVIHRNDGPIGMAVYCHDLQPVNFRS
jgi:hypothetical protein